MNSASPHPRSTSQAAQDTRVSRASALLTVSAELHTGGRTYHWDIGRPDTAADPGFLYRAFRHLDDRTL